MKGLHYYLDVDNNFVLAHEPSTEFFVTYNEKTETWVTCTISFMQFKHDYLFREITKEEAVRQTNGNLPERAFQKYVETLQANVKHS